MCNLCKSVDHKANVCPFSWARETTGSSPPHEEVVSVADPVDNHDKTDNDMFEDDEEEKDENEDQNLHATSDTNDVFVADAGIPLCTRLNTDSSTAGVSTEKMDETPQATVEESPLLSSVDTTEQNPRITDSTTPNSGHKPAKLMEINIPLQNPTHPTLVTGKTAEKRDNTDLLKEK